MSYGASNRIYSNAKSLRNRMTFAEKILWSKIRNNQLGYHFRRQHPISCYVADFYCHELKLVIEVDGNIHEDKTVIIEDQNKEATLLSYGITVLRMKNEHVINKIDEAIKDILKTAEIILNANKNVDH